MREKLSKDGIYSVKIPKKYVLSIKKYFEKRGF